MSTPHNVNPMQIIQMIKGGANPQQLLMQIMQQSPMAQTPMGVNLLQLLAEGRTQDIEKIARNVSHSRGVDFDKEFLAFRRSLGL